uniref:Uncharacterized protein n=1 Tax=Cuerna arida TaxID=1464854 RepID=A0A1B6G1F1_9HEMI
MQSLKRRGSPLPSRPMKKFKLTHTSSSLEKSSVRKCKNKASGGVLTTSSQKPSKKRKQDNSVQKHKPLLGSHSNQISNKYYNSTKSFLSPLKETKRRQQRKKSVNISEDTESNQVIEKCVNGLKNNSISTLSTSKQCQKKKYKKFLLQEWKYKRIDAYLMKNYVKPSELSQLNSHKTGAIIEKHNENYAAVPIRNLMQKIIEDCISESNAKNIASEYGGTAEKTTFTNKSDVGCNNTSGKIEQKPCEGTSILTVHENNPIFDTVLDNKEPETSYQKDFTDKISSTTNDSDSPNNTTYNIEVCEKSCKESVTLTEQESRPLFKDSVGTKDSDESPLIENNADEISENRKAYLNDTSDDINTTNDSPNNKTDNIEVCEKSCEESVTQAEQEIRPLFEDSVGTKDSDESPLIENNADEISENRKAYLNDTSDDINTTNDSPNNKTDNIEVCEKSCEESVTQAEQEIRPLFEDSVGTKDSEQEITEPNKTSFVENEQLSQCDGYDQCTSFESRTSPSAVMTPTKDENCSNNNNIKVFTGQTNWLFPKIKLISQPKFHGKTCSNHSNQLKVKSKHKHEEKTKNENSNQHKLKKGSPNKMDNVKKIHNIDHYFAPVVKKNLHLTSCKNGDASTSTVIESENAALLPVVESSQLQTLSLPRKIEKRPLNEVNCNIITNMC